MKGITKEIKKEGESWCSNSSGLWKEETTTNTQSHHTAVSRLWMLPLPCSHPRAWMEETHKMKARPCSKPNIQILHNDWVLNSGFMSSLILMACIVFSRKTLLLNFSAKEGCTPASHLSPSSTCCDTRWDTAKRWHAAVRIQGVPEVRLPVPSSTFSTSITSVLIRPRKMYRCPSVDALLFFSRLKQMKPQSFCS